jgi:hypothetical protein
LNNNSTVHPKYTAPRHPESTPKRRQAPKFSRRGQKGAWHQKYENNIHFHIDDSAQSWYE